MKTSIPAHWMRTGLFALGMNGVFTLAGAHSGRLDASMALPLALGIALAIATDIERRYAGPAWLLQAFAVSGVALMPAWPLLAHTLDALTPFAVSMIGGILGLMLFAAFCATALHTLPHRERKKAGRT